MLISFPSVGLWVFESPPATPLKKLKKKRNYTRIYTISIKIKLPTVTTLQPLPLKKEYRGEEEIYF